MDVSYVGEVECARWAALPAYLRRQALLLDLELKMDIQNSFLRQSVAFRVSGSVSSVDRFKKRLSEDIESYVSITTE